MGRERHSKPPSSPWGRKKHNKGPASFKLRACMGGKKSPQIHHHHSGDKEPLERNCPPTPPTTQNFQLRETLVFSTKREVNMGSMGSMGSMEVREKLVLRISSCSVEVKDMHWKWKVSELKIWATYRQLSYYYSLNQPTFSTFLQLLWPCLQFHPSQSDQLPQTPLPEARFRLLFPRAR